MLDPLITLVIVAAIANGLEVAFEKVEQLSGFDLFDSSLRVRKYNRTTVVLNGTVITKQPIDDSFIVSMDLWHSRLGNQQFNHYPMKLPTQGACKFLYDVYRDYYKYIDDIVNLPEKDECPISPREGHILDKVFPSKAISPVVPQGLWKAFVFVKVLEDEKARFEVIVKVYTENFL